MAVHSKPQSPAPQATSMQEEIVYTNLGSGDTYDTEHAHEIPNYPAQDLVEFLAFSFSPTANCSFTQLKVAIGPGAGAETARVYLAKDFAGTPSLVILSASRAVLPMGGIVPVLVGTKRPFGPFDLLAEETYWLWLGSNTPNSKLAWYYNPQGVVGPSRVNNSKSWEPTTSGVQGAFCISGRPL